MAWKIVGAKGRIYVSSVVTQAKLSALKSYGVEVNTHGKDCIEAEALARQVAEVFIFSKKYILIQHVML